MTTETKTYCYEDYETTLNPKLPALVGSEKQINWAGVIRLSAGKQFFAWFDDAMAHLPAGISQEEVDLASTRALAGWNKVMEQTSAAWWIDNRHSTGPHLPNKCE